MSQGIELTSMHNSPIFKPTQVDPDTIRAIAERDSAFRYYLQSRQLLGSDVDPDAIQRAYQNYYLVRPLKPEPRDVLQSVESEVFSEIPLTPEELAAQASENPVLEWHLDLASPDPKSQRAAYFNYHQDPQKYQTDFEARARAQPEEEQKQQSEEEQKHQEEQKEQKQQQEEQKQQEQEDQKAEQLDEFTAAYANSSWLPSWMRFENPYAWPFLITLMILFIIYFIALNAVASQSGGWITLSWIVFGVVGLVFLILGYLWIRRETFMLER